MSLPGTHLAGAGSISVADSGSSTAEASAIEKDRSVPIGVKPVVIQNQIDGTQVPIGPPINISYVPRIEASSVQPPLDEALFLIRRPNDVDEKVVPMLSPKSRANDAHPARRRR